MLSRGAGTLARGILSETGTPDDDLAGKSARAPVRTNAEQHPGPPSKTPAALVQSKPH